MDVLESLTEHEKTVLGGYFEEVVFCPGECVMRQGDPGSGCYVIDSGTVRVEINSSNGASVNILGYLEAGSLVGEMSSFGLAESAGARSASVYAHTPVRLRFLSTAWFAELTRVEPRVALAFTCAVTNDMARKLRQTNARLSSYVPDQESSAKVEELVATAMASGSKYASEWAATFLSDVPSDVEIMDAFLERGIDTFCMVADSILAPMDQYLMDLAEQGRANRWVMPSERSVPAVAIGRWLATGQLSLMTMQNSGFSNAMDYLRSVMLVHRIPGILLESWRGFDHLLDISEPHILLGDVTHTDSVNVVGEAHVHGTRDGIGLRHAVQAALEDAFLGNLVCLRVSPPGFKKTCALRLPRPGSIRRFDPDYFDAVRSVKGKAFRAVRREPLRSRDETLVSIHEQMRGRDPFYIVGNGFNARAMQALRLTPMTFENSGGMGSSLAIAWGAAKSNPGQVFVAIDGDQNAVMSEMEKVLSSDYPDNLYWFILDNGIGESVGPSISLPLSPWHYELAQVIQTRCEAPGTFPYDRVNSSGMKFDSPAALALAEKYGNLPAQAMLARELLAQAHAARSIA